ncbi:MAG: kinase-like domain-containing protein [Benjaminiella poitrasii]|nr:MAG: kinase-like domain-containing protein [Benjaminiella poitrasii]
MKGWKPTTNQFHTLYEQLFHHYFNHPIEIERGLRCLFTSLLWFPPHWFEHSQPLHSGRMGQVYIAQLAFVSIAAEATLEQLIPQIDQWSFQRIFKTALITTAAVKNYHQQNKVHPNLQPKNFMMFSQQKKAMALVDDWCQGNGSHCYRTFQCCYGRYPYIAPEIIRNNSTLTQQANIYSLGIILWQLASGVLFPVSVAAIPDIYQLTSISRFIDPAYEQLVMQCLSSNPNLRPTADQVYKALIRILMTDKALSCQADNYNSIMIANKRQHAAEVKERQWIIAKYLAYNTDSKEDVEYLLYGASLAKRIAIQTIISFEHHFHNLFSDGSHFHQR